ncbi:hypothetical protein Dimus_010166 [Dionaea muscipula]
MEGIRIEKLNFIGLNPLNYSCAEARLDILIIACLGHCQPMVTNVQVLVTFGRQSLPLCFLVVIVLFGWTIKQMVNLIQVLLFFLLQSLPFCAGYCTVLLMMGCSGTFWNT